MTVVRVTRHRRGHNHFGEREKWPKNGNLNLSFLGHTSIKFPHNLNGGQFNK